MPHYDRPDELGNEPRAEHGRMALAVFAELTQQGGANAIADAEGISLVVPGMIAALLHLLDAEGLPAGPAISDALSSYNAEHERDGRELPDPIGMLRRIYQSAREEGPGITHPGRLDEVMLCLTDRGWSDYGSPYEP